MAPDRNKIYITSLKLKLLGKDTNKISVSSTHPRPHPPFLNKKKKGRVQIINCLNKIAETFNTHFGSMFLPHILVNCTIPPPPPGWGEKKKKGEIERELAIVSWLEARVPWPYLKSKKYHTSDEHWAATFPRCVASLLLAGKMISYINFR